MELYIWKIRKNINDSICKKIDFYEIYEKCLDETLMNRYISPAIEMDWL